LTYFGRLVDFDLKLTFDLDYINLKKHANPCLSCFVGN